LEGAELKAWRRAERQRLLALRTALPPADRRQCGVEIECGCAPSGATPGWYSGRLLAVPGRIRSAPLIDWLMTRGSAVALPAVIDKKGPLEYRAWRPGEPLVDGVWDIPVPQRRDIVSQKPCWRRSSALTAVLPPRLWRRLLRSYIGALSPRPLAIGVGFELSQIETIYPQAFDIPMDVIVTEAETRRI